MSQSNQKDQNVNQFNKFLQNNEDFLQEKYNQFFKKPNIALKELNKQSAIKYIYDVFSFQKYQSDQKMNLTLQKSLLKNIDDFLLLLGKRKANINNKTAIELLKYCIQNNQMFAVKYDKKQKKIKTEQHMNQSTFTQKQQAGTKQLQQKQQKQDVQQKPDQIQQDKSQEGENKNQNNDVNQDVMVNQFDQSKKNSPEKVADPDLIKKNLKQMFQFYCKQQQNVGAHTTFDRISYQCKTMTLGKFLSFATNTAIINDKIDKNLIMRKFKLIAQGKKQIQFQQFFQIIQTLAGIDEALIPKLGVDEKVQFKAKLKQRYMPFYTKDQSSREIKRDHIYIPKLTGHSGKLSDALYEQIKLRKQLKVASSSLSHTKPTEQNEQNQILKTPFGKNRYQSNSSKIHLKQGSQIVTSPTQLTNSHIRDFQQDLGFIQKMINAQQTDQQWLKQYKLPANYKKTNALPPRLINRKQSIVPNLKKRVEELERTQTRQTAHLQKRQYVNRRQRQRNSKSILI